MRIAMVAPPWYPVPPLGYGGIELVVHLLTGSLTRGGHEVILFAAEGSQHNAIELAPSDWSQDLGRAAHVIREATYLARVYARLDEMEVDVVHEHNESAGLVVATRRPPAPTVATIHSDLAEPHRTFMREVEGKDVGLVAISAAQAARAPEVPWLGTVHNAVDVDALICGAEKGGYLLELARICPDKAQHIAIGVAAELGLPLILAGKIEERAESEAYFRDQIEPHLGERVRWLPDVGGKDKAALLAGADAMLFPIQWEEPFGLAMVEAMASGTPVVAIARGAAPELIDEGVTGFLAHDADGMVAACRRIHEIDTRRCAEVARDRFSPDRMAAGYLEIYRAAIERFGTG